MINKTHISSKKPNPVKEGSIHPTTYDNTNI